MRYARLRGIVVAVALLVIVAVGVAVAVAPAGKPLTVTVISQRLNGAFPVVARVGDQFKITLDSNATTGFKWQLAAKPNQKVAKKLSSVYNDPSESIPGRGGSETWTFKAVGKGKTTIVLSYDQPWEKGTKGERIQKFEVEVREPGPHNGLRY